MNKVLTIGFKRILLFSMLVFSLIMVPKTTVNAESKAITCSSENEFFTNLSKQISQHKESQSYFISDEKLRNSIMSGNGVLVRFQAHFNKKNPYYSGCYWCMYLSNVKIVQFSGSSKIRANIKYSYNKETMDSYMDELKKVSDELKSDNDYESIKAVHDYLVHNIEYDYKNTNKKNYTDLEGWRDGVMVCHGYAMATFLLLNDMGIPTRIILGDADNGSGSGKHAWNAVCLDGNWYYMDCTWDDMSRFGASYNYFLRGQNTFNKDHTPDKVFAEEDLLNTVSTTDYSLPLSLDMWRILINMGIYIIVGLVVIVIVIIVVKSKNKNAAGSYIKVVDDDGPKF